MHNVVKRHEVSKRIHDKVRSKNFIIQCEGITPAVELGKVRPAVERIRASHFIILEQAVNTLVVHLFGIGFRPKQIAQTGPIGESGIPVLQLLLHDIRVAGNGAVGRILYHVDPLWVLRRRCDQPSICQIIRDNITEVHITCAPKSIQRRNAARTAALLEAGHFC